MAIPSSSSGTSGDRTVIAAVNPRQAIITINDGANNYPTGSGNPMGIGVDANYLTFSGLRFSDWHFYAIQVAANEFLIEDSQFDDFNTLKGNIADTNMGAFTSARGTLPLNMTVRNSEFFDIRNDEYTMNSSAVAAFGNFFGMGDTFIAEYNTIYRIGNNNGSALYAKNDSGSIIFRYNYLYDVGGIVFGMGLVDTTEFSGSLYRVHNNVVRAQGFARSSGTEAELVLAQTFEVYNNTFVQTANDGSGNTYWMFGNNNSLSSSGAGNTVKWYNNILRSTGFTVSGGILIQSCCGNAVQVFGGNEDIVDYNLYTAPTFTVPEGNTTSLATWRGYFSNGTDQNTISTAPTFVNASGTAAADFDLQAGSAGENAGSIDGAGGGATDMGAWGGASAPSRIGTDW
jgi:hypothetical protein